MVYECKDCSCMDSFETAPKECPSCGSKRCTLHYGQGVEKFLSGIRLSYSLGCNPNEIPKFQKMWPWMKFTPDGRCITENYQERKRVIKSRGFTDLQ